MPLEIRRSHLPAEVAYFLDGADECGEITSAAHWACMLYGDPEILLRIVQRDNDVESEEQRRRVLSLINQEATPLGFGFIKRRHDRAFDVERYAWTLIEQCSEMRQELLKVYAAISIFRSIRDYSEFLARCAYEDSTIGGCMVKRRDLALVTPDQRPTPRLERRLRSPKAIRRYVRFTSNDEMRDHRRRLIKLAFRRHLDSLQLTAFDNERNLINRELEQQQVDTRQYELQRARNIEGIINGIKPAVHRKEVSRQRKVIRKSAAIAAAVVGASTVSAFARGEPVELRGADLTFALEANGSMLRTGHGAMTVSLKSHEGAPLAKLCVYHEKTPALDQLAAFGLAIAAGEERDILETGNLYLMEPAALEHPALQERAAARMANGQHPVPVWQQAAVVRPLRRFVEQRDLFREQQARYVDETADIYREAMAEIYFGRKARQYVSAIALLKDMERF